MRRKLPKKMFGSFTIGKPLKMVVMQQPAVSSPELPPAKSLVDLPKKFDYSPKEYVEGKDYFGWTPAKRDIVVSTRPAKYSAIVFTNPKYPSSSIWYSPKQWQTQENVYGQPHQPSNAIKVMNKFPSDLRTFVNMTGADMVFNRETRKIEPSPILALQNFGKGAVAAQHRIIPPGRIPERSVILTWRNSGDDRTSDISHELGHQVEEERLTPEERTAWQKLSKKRIEGLPNVLNRESTRPFSPSTYGATSEKEDFAETFAAYQSGIFDKTYAEQMKRIDDRIRRIQEKNAPDTDRDLIMSTRQSDLDDLYALKHRLKGEILGRKAILDSVSKREGIEIASDPSELHFVDSSGEYSGIKEASDLDLPAIKYRPQDMDVIDFEADQKISRPYALPSIVSPLKQDYEKTSTKKEAEGSSKDYSSEPSEEEVEAAAEKK